MHRNIAARAWGAITHNARATSAAPKNDGMRVFRGEAAGCWNPRMSVANHRYFKAEAECYLLRDEAPVHTTHCVRVKTSRRRHVTGIAANSLATSPAPGYSDVIEINDLK
jgi:hypothetical protein